MTSKNTPVKVDDGETETEKRFSRYAVYEMDPLEI